MAKVQKSVLKARSNFRQPCSKIAVVRLKYVGQQPSPEQRTRIPAFQQLRLVRKATDTIDIELFVYYLSNTYFQLL